MAVKPTTYTDQQLKIACLEGHPDAQRYLYESFAAYVFTICRKYFVPAHYQKDMIQDIFSEVFMKLQHFNPKKGSLKVWIRQISVHRVIDYKRKSGRIQNFESNSTFTESTAPDVWEKLYLEDFLRLIEPMPEGYRIVFMLNISEGYNHNEISEMLGISKETSRSQLSRAKNWLRKNISIENKTTYR